MRVNRRRRGRDGHEDDNDQPQDMWTYEDDESFRIVCFLGSPVNPCDAYAQDSSRFPKDAQIDV
eukprot:3328972-Pyramimonas_sp.AAC.1